MQPKDELAQETAASKFNTPDTETPARTMSVDEFLNGWTPGVDPTPAPATVTAKNGDSISKLLGTSNPIAVEAFMRANDLSGSTIYAGRDYVMPGDADYAASNGRAGQAVLNQDNARLAQAHSIYDQDGLRIGPTIERAQFAGAYSEGSFATPTSYMQATPTTLRENIVDGLRGVLGDSNAAGVAVGLTKAYLYSADNLIDGIRNAPGAVAGLASSLWNDPLGTVGNGVDSFRAGYRTLISDSAAGQEARGSFLFSAGVTAMTGGMGRVGTLEGFGDAARYENYWTDLAKTPASLSDRSARAWYLSEEMKIPAMIDTAMPLEAQAKQAFEMRNEMRSTARDLMADRAHAEYLTRTEPNMTWNQVVELKSQKYSGDALWNSIIQSSQKSRQSVNDGFGFIGNR